MIPNALKKMLIKPMISLSVQAYKQAKSDLEKKDYDPKRFEKELKEQFRTKLPF